MDNTREKLIEILRVPIYPHLDADPAEAVADYLLDSGVTVQKWIPVTERLPKLEKCILVATTHGTVGEAFRHWDGLFYWIGDEYTNELSVTHWMPLPEPPKEG